MIDKNVIIKLQAYWRSRQCRHILPNAIYVIIKLQAYWRSRQYRPICVHTMDGGKKRFIFIKFSPAVVKEWLTCPTIAFFHAGSEELVETFNPGDTLFAMPGIIDSSLDEDILYASANGKVEQVRELLEIGANVNAATKSGWTPLHFADLCNGWTPLHFASADGDEAMVTLLLKHGADVNAVNEDMWTALLWASFKGHFWVVRLLLEKGADVKVAGVEKDTPLHWACCKGHEAVVTLLLKYDADILAENVANKQPISFASHYAIKILLQEHAIKKILQGHEAELLQKYGAK